MSIERHSGDNIGSIYKLHIAFAKALPPIDPDADVIPASIFQQYASVLEEVYFTPGTGLYTQDAQESIHGDFFVQNITISIPRNRYDVLKALRKYKGAAIACLVETHNQDRILVGSMQQPLSLISSLVFGNDVSDRNHRAVIIKGTSINEAPFSW